MNKIHPYQKSNNNSIVQEKPNFFLRDLELHTLISFRCTHVVFFFCWFGLILSGTTIIGFGATKYSAEFEYCSETEEFCTYDLSLAEDHNLTFYTKISPFYQNNRLYLDAFSLKQLHGENGTATFCQDYSKYKELEVESTVGGYRVNPDYNIHPCGYPMKTILNDNFYIVDGQGTTPNLQNSLSSNFSATYHFSRLSDYQSSQWTDVESSRFINWFTIPFTSVKYVMMGRLEMTAGDYELVVRNSYLTNDEFTKSVIVTENNSLGMTNHLLGFCIFAYGISMLLLHVFICCKSKD